MEEYSDDILKLEKYNQYLPRWKLFNAHHTTMKWEISGQSKTGPEFGEWLVDEWDESAFLVEEDGEKEEGSVAPIVMEVETLHPFQWNPLPLNFSGKAH